MSVIWHVDLKAVPEADRELFSSMDVLLSAPMDQVTQDSISGFPFKAVAHVLCQGLHGQGEPFQVSFRCQSVSAGVEKSSLFPADRFVDAPVLVAHGKRGISGVLHAGAMITLETESATDLQKYLEAGKLYERGVPGARDLLDQLAHATRLLHEDRFYHWDLKTRNVLAD